MLIVTHKAGLNGFMKWFLLMVSGTLPTVSATVHCVFLRINNVNICFQRTAAPAKVAQLVTVSVLLGYVTYFTPNPLCVVTWEGLHARSYVCCCVFLRTLKAAAETRLDSTVFLRKLFTRCSFHVHEDWAYRGNGISFTALTDAVLPGCTDVTSHVSQTVCFFFFFFCFSL